MAINYTSGSINLICDLILESIENEVSEREKNIFRTAGQRVEEKCQEVAGIEWRMVFYELVKLGIEPLKVNKISQNNNTKEKEKILPPEIDQEIGQALLKQAEKNDGAFTWKLKSDGCELENKLKDFYTGGLRNKQEKFETIIEDIDNKNDQIINIFYTLKNKQIEWRFSAIDAEKFYEGFKKNSNVSTINIKCSNKFYIENCSSVEWKDKCNLLRIVLEWEKVRLKDKHIQYVYFRELKEVLCKLVPVFYKTDEGFKLKSEEQWISECERIRGAVYKKVEELGLDEYCADIIDMEMKTLKMLRENKLYDDKEKDVFKEKYIDFMRDADVYFREKIDNVHDISNKLKAKTKDDYRNIYEGIKNKLYKNI